MNKLKPILYSIYFMNNQILNLTGRGEMNYRRLRKNIKNNI